MQRRIVSTLAGEVVQVATVMAGVGVVGSYVDRVGRNGHRRRKTHLLPPGGGLVSERGRSQTRAGAAPEIRHMGAGIGARLIETDPGNGAIGIGTEFHAQFHCAVRSGVRCPGNGRVRPNAGTGWQRNGNRGTPAGRHISGGILNPGVEDL